MPLYQDKKILKSWPLKCVGHQCEKKIHSSFLKRTQIFESKCQIKWEIVSNFVAFLENLNFKGLVPSQFAVSGKLHWFPWKIKALFVPFFKVWWVGYRFRSFLPISITTPESAFQKINVFFCANEIKDKNQSSFLTFFKGLVSRLLNVWR